MCVCVRCNKEFWFVSQSLRQMQNACLAACFFRLKSPSISPFIVCFFFFSLSRYLFSCSWLVLINGPFVWMGRPPRLLKRSSTVGLGKLNTYIQIFKIMSVVLNNNTHGAALLLQAHWYQSPKLLPGLLRPYWSQKHCWGRTYRAGRPGKRHQGKANAAHNTKEIAKRPCFNTCK